MQCPWVIPKSSPPPRSMEKIVFHKTSPWGQKSWGPLFLEHLNWPFTRNVKISYALRPLLNLYRKNSLRICRTFISPSLFFSAFQHLFCSIDKICGDTARTLLKTGSSILRGTVHATGNLASPQKLPAHYSSPLLLVLYLRATQSEFTWPSHSDPSNTEGHILA